MNRDYPFRLFDLTGKTIVLTGSAGRLGTNFAHTLSHAGAALILVDTDDEKNQKLKKFKRLKSKTSFTKDSIISSEYSELVSIFNFPMSIISSVSCIFS